MVQTAVEPKTAWDRMELFVRPHEIYGTKQYHMEPFIRPCGTARNRLRKKPSIRLNGTELDSMGPRQMLGLRHSDPGELGTWSKWAFGGNGHRGKWGFGEMMGTMVNGHLEIWRI